MDVLHDTDLTAAATGPTVVSIGVYDGVHLGHQAVLASLSREAAERGLRSAVVTFDRHPALVLRPENAPHLLTTLEQKLELLEAAGVDITYVVHFDVERSRTEPLEFVRQVFVRALQAQLVVVGEDFHFGRDRAGNVAVLTEIGEDQAACVAVAEQSRRPARVVQLNIQLFPLSETAEGATE